MNLLKAASTVSAFTLASRVTGLARDLLMASAFGANALTDAFNVAFRIPNLLRRLFAEGAFSQAFVPVLAAARAADGDDATHRLIDAVATALFWALVLTVVVGVVGAPVLVWSIASGLAAFDQGVVMTRIMFPYIACMSLVALSAGILNTWKRFALPAATPVLLNLSWIASAIWLAPWFARQGIEPIYGLAAGVMAGGLLQLAVQVPALARIGALPRIGLLPGAMCAAWAHPGVATVLRNMAPALLGVSVAQISLLINTQIASRVSVGAVSWLTYADRLMEFPTALLGVALGVVLTPQLAAAQGRMDGDGYSALLDWGLRMVVLLALPCAVALLTLAEPLVAVLFHYGAFKDGDVSRTAWAVMGWGVGLMGIVGVKILAPGFYARQDVRTPVRIAVVVLVVTQLLNLVLVPWMGHAALALSIGLGAILNALWLLRGLLRMQVYRPAAGWGVFAARAVVASVAMGAGLVWAAQAFDWVGLRAQPWHRVGLLAAVVAGGIVVYFAVLAILGLRPRHVMRRA
jgi:putative peptidoglycan lipid II flippase